MVRVWFGAPNTLQVGEEGPTLENWRAHGDSSLGLEVNSEGHPCLRAHLHFKLNLCDGDLGASGTQHLLHLASAYALGHQMLYIHGL